MADTHFVLFRDGEGRAAALADRCPHRFAPLSAGTVSAAGRLTCPYHGWNFDAAGKGLSPSQPTLAKCDVPSFQVREAHGYLWLANRDVPASAMPDLVGDAAASAGSFSMRVAAPLHVVLDAFSEVEHAPFVHKRLAWDEDGIGSIAFNATSHPDRTEVRYDAAQRVSVASRLLGLRRGDRFHTRITTRFSPVHNVHRFHWTDAVSGEPRAFGTISSIFYVPETARTVRLHVFVFVEPRDPSMRWILPLAKPLARFVAEREVRDDRRILELLVDAPFEMDGMRLGKLDAPLIHHRRLLKKVYFAGNREAAEESGAGKVRTPSETLRIAG